MNFSSKKTPSLILTIFAGLCVLPDAWAAIGDPGLSPVASPVATASLGLAIVKVVGALALVVGLMVLTMKIIRKIGLGSLNHTSGALISILDTKMIAPKKYVAVLKIADELVAVGITDQQINLISHLDKSSAAFSLASSPETPSGGFSFPAILDRAAGSIKNLKHRHN